MTLELSHDTTAVEKRRDRGYVWVFTLAKLHVQWEGLQSTMDANAQRRRGIAGCLQTSAALLDKGLPDNPWILDIPRIHRGTK